VARAVAGYRAGVQERLRAAELERTAAQARAQEAQAREAAEVRARQAVEAQAQEARAAAAAERRARRRTLGLAAALLLLVLAGLGGLWAWQEQRGRKARHEGEARAVLERARTLREEGWKGRDANLQAHDMAKLKEAAAEAKRAVDIARSGSAGQDVQQEALAFQKQAEATIQRARKNRALLDALLDVALPQETRAYKEGGSGTMVALAQPSADDQYAAAFRRWGLDLDRPAEAEVVARLRLEPEVVREDLVAALDGWMQERRRREGLGGKWRRLYQMAERL
jgi:hypothetical protein